MKRKRKGYKSGLINKASAGVSVWKTRYIVNLLKINTLSGGLILMMLQISGQFRKFVISAVQENNESIQNSYRSIKVNSSITNANLADLMEKIIETDGTYINRCIDVFLQSVHLTNLKNSAYEKKLEKKFDQIRNTLHLTEEEVAVLRFFYYFNADETLETIFNDTSTSIGPVKFIASVTGESSGRITRTLKKDGKLRSSELLDIRSDLSHGSISEDVMEFIQGTAGGNILQEVFKKDRGSVYPVESFFISDRERSDVLSLLNRKGGSNILFYGIPGTGKTELARSLGRFLKKDVYFIRQGDSGNSFELKFGLESANQFFDPQKSLIIMDEADQLLNTRSGFEVLFKAELENNKVKKGWINQFLETTNQKIIWITNRSDGIESSVKRRFDYSITFHSFTARERLELWKRIVKKHSLRKHLDLDFLKSMSESFPVNASGITGILESVSTLPDIQKKSTDEIQSVIVSHTEKQVELITGKLPAVKRTEKSLYDPSALATSMPVRDIEKILCTYYNKQDLDKKNSHPMNLLFYGLPGTGKTELARQLAKNLGRELIVKRSSDLLSPWVGMTEQLIAQAFAKAEKSRAVLLIDEIDTFLMKRTGNSRSWEISHVNEFLTRMESFTGAFIGTTNLMNDLDRAALRRFSFKVEFLPLDASGMRSLFDRYASFYFPGHTHLIPKKETDLEEIVSLTDAAPGDFHAVFSKLRYLDGSDLTIDCIAGELKEEVICKREEGDKKNRIGFG